MMSITRMACILGVLALLCTFGAITSVSEEAEGRGWDIVTIDFGRSSQPYYGLVEPYTSLALDSHGHEHIGYVMYYGYGPEPTLKYAAWTEHGLIVQYVDDVDFFSRASLALDSSNNPHMAYKARNHFLKYATWNESGWNLAVVDAVGPISGSPALALDGGGYPRIAYCNNGNLSYARWNGTTWSVEVVDSGGYVGWYVSLALDSSGNPQISYQDRTNKDLKFARFDGSSWEIATVDSGGDVGESSSLALDANGRAHISYQEAGRDDLRYAHWNGHIWMKETVEWVGSVGQDPSIALDDAGRPHIAYRGDGSLRYARWNGTAWLNETVDPEYGTGWGASIRVGLDGYPRISYGLYDWANASVRYARNEPNEPPWASIDGMDYAAVNQLECFYVHGSDPDNDKFRITIDWGDGKSSYTDYVKKDQYVRICHQWEVPGDYPITATATDTHGAVSSERPDMEIHVYDPTPKPFYELPWFWIIIALVVLDLEAVALEIRRRRKRRKESLQSDEQSPQPSK